MTDWADVEDREAVGALMRDVLDRIVAVFEAEDVDLPDRRYLHIGPTAHDCDQLTVSFMQMYLGAPGSRASQAQPCNSPRSVVMTIELTRGTVNPTGRGTQAPDAEATTENTLDRTSDAWLLMEAALSARDDYLGGVLADVAVQRESGGKQSVILNLTTGVP